MRWSWCAFVLACCAPSEEVARVVDLKQGFGAGPDVIGALDSGLGTSLAACRGGGFVAGSPGNGSVLLTNDGGVIGPGSNGLGRVVACVAGKALSAGVPGLAVEAAGGSWQPLSSTSTVALARSDLADLPLLVGEASGTVRFLDPVTKLEVAAALSGPPGFGASVAWFPQSRRFAVGDPDAGLVRVYDLEDDGGVMLVTQLQDPAIPGFGRSIAAGDLSPRPGLELAVASRGRVSTFQLDGGVVFRIPGLSTSLGQALVVSRGYAAGLDSLWVGEPIAGRVSHFVGDAGTFTTRSGIAFGSSIAVDDQRRVAVGAPGYPSGDAGGALFFESLGAPVAGVVMECTVGPDCATRTCELGDCLGGVLCINLVNQCSAGQSCAANGACVPDADAGVTDAGVMDAGVTDAGALDAGPVEVDAGLVDAGLVDAPVDDGVLVFDTCGCSGGAMPVLLLCLMLLRRRDDRATLRAW